MHVHQFMQALSHKTFPHYVDAMTLCGFPDELLWTMKVDWAEEPLHGLGVAGILQINEGLPTDLEALSNIPLRIGKGISMICATSGATNKDFVTFGPTCGIGISVIFIE